MELRHLRYFLAVVRYGKMTTAAEALHISQPSLSAQIKQFEEELDVQLFDRTQRELKLTEAGEIVKRYAVSILKEVKDIETELEDLKNLKRGRIVIGSLPTIMVTWLPRMISSFKAKYPEVEIAIHDMSTEELKKELLEGNIDIGFITYPIDESIFECVPLLQEELFLIVPLDHPLSSRSHIDMNRLVEEPFIMFGKKTQSRNTIIEACKKAGFFPRIVHESDKVEIVISFVSAGLGVAFVPKGSLDLRKNRDVAVLSVDNPKPFRTICLAYNKRRYISHAMKSFQTHLVSHFSKQDFFKDLAEYQFLKCVN